MFDVFVLCEDCREIISPRQLCNGFCTLCGGGPCVSYGIRELAEQRKRELQGRDIGKGILEALHSARIVAPVQSAVAGYVLSMSSPTESAAQQLLPFQPPEAEAPVLGSAPPEPRPTAPIPDAMSYGEEEVHQLLGCKRSKLTELLAEGMVKQARRVGRRRRFTKASVDAYQRFINGEGPEPTGSRRGKKSRSKPTAPRSPAAPPAPAPTETTDEALAAQRRELFGKPPRR
jgi:excisionase family DNA binding protein